MAVAWVSGGSYSANYSPTSSGSAAFDWSGAFTPTAGNCLVAFFSCGVIDAGVVDAPSGWTLVHNNNSGSLGGTVFYKENCAASDTAFTLVSTAASINGVATVREYSGGKTSGILDANGKAEDVANVTTTTATQATGTTGTRSQANGLGIAFVAGDSGANIADDAWSSGWGSTVVYANRTTSSGHRIAEKSITSTAGDSATLTLSASDQAYGVILILDEAAGAGGLSIPIAAYHYQHHLGSMSN